MTFYEHILIQNCYPDTDECASTTLNDCQQMCTNTIGGHSCSCMTGYNIDPDNVKLCKGRPTYHSTATMVALKITA